MRVAFCALMCALAALAAGPAQATGTIACAAVDESDAALTITTGAGPVRTPIRVEIAAGGQRWTTGGGDGQTVAVLQAFDHGERLDIDLADPQLNEIKIALRLITASAGRGEAQVAILAIAGKGAHALICEGP